MTLALAAALAKQSLDRQMIHIQHFDCWSKRVDICYSRVSCVYVYILYSYMLSHLCLYFGYIDLQRFFLHVKLFKIVNMHRQHIIHDKYLDRGTFYAKQTKHLYPIQAVAAPPQLPLWAASGFFFLAMQSTIFVFKDIHRSYPNILNIRAGGYMMVF